MKTNLKKLEGSWNLGFALDKHTISSTYTGVDEYGHSTFDTRRTEVGESLFQLKFRQDANQIDPLAQQLADSIYPKFENVGLIIPMPATTQRQIQPVTLLAKELAEMVGLSSFDNILTKNPEGQQLKNLNGKAEKLEALDGVFKLTDRIEGQGPWNALLVDDLFDTGASMEMACATLRDYAKISKIFVATLTWK